VKKVFRVHPALKETLELQALQVQLAHRVPLVQREIKATRVQSDCT
jgi:hypothetical protein